MAEREEYGVFCRRPLVKGQVIARLPLSVAYVGRGTLEGKVTREQIEADHPTWAPLLPWTWRAPIFDDASLSRCLPEFEARLLRRIRGPEWPLASLVHSRAWTLAGTKYWSPFMDALNHAPDLGRTPPPPGAQRGAVFATHHRIEDQHLVLYSDRDVPTGVEVREDYGDNPSYVYAAFLGFVPDENPYEDARADRDPRWADFEVPVDAPDVLCAYARDQVRRAREQQQRTDL